MISAKQDKFTGEFLGTGRRKTSVARVRICPGDGKIKINKRSLEEFFANPQDRNNVLAPLEMAENKPHSRAAARAFSA